MDNLIRGGQNSVHNLKMFRQVFGWCFGSSVGVGVVIFCASLYLSKPDVIDINTYIRIFKRYAIEMETKITKRPASFEDNKKILAGMLEGRRLYKASKESLKWSIIGAGVTMVFSLCFFLRYGKNKKADITLRGNGLRPFASFVSNRKKVKGAGNYSLANIPLYKEEENTHIAIIGTTGTGKTQILLDLMEQIKKKGDKAVVYDPKGEFIQYFYNNSTDFITNPYDERGIKWNILNEILSDVGCSSLAKAISPAEYRGDAIWSKAAALVIEHFLINVKISGQSLTNREILKKILDRDGREKFLRDTVVQGILPQDSAPTAASVLFMVANSLEGILKLHDSKPEESFSVRSWLACEKPSILFMGGRFEAATALASFHAVLVDVLLQGIRDGSSGKKIWIILDELATLGRINTLREAVSTVRSYNACFALGFQSKTQLDTLYGRDVASGIITDCNTMIATRTNDGDTAEFISKAFGASEVINMRENITFSANDVRDSVSLQQHQNIKKTLIPSEIMELKNLNYVFKGVDGCTRGEIQYKKRNIITPCYIPDESKRFFKGKDNEKEETVQAQTKEKEDNKQEEVKKVIEKDGFNCLI